MQKLMLVIEGESNEPLIDAEFPSEEAKTAFEDGFRDGKHGEWPSRTFEHTIVAEWYGCGRTYGEVSLKLEKTIEHSLV